MKRIALLLTAVMMTSCMNDVDIARYAYNGISHSNQSKAERCAHRHIKDYIIENYTVPMSHLYELIEFHDLQRDVLYTCDNVVVRYNLRHEFYYLSGIRRYKIDCVWIFDHNMNFIRVRINGREFDDIIITDEIIPYQNEIYGN